MNASRSSPLDWRIVIASIIGFWLFHAMVVTLRAMVMDFPSQGELAERRVFVTLIGMVVTAMMWLIQRQFDKNPLWSRVAAAAIIAIPAAMAIGAANYYFFNVFDPAGLLDIEKMLDRDKKPSMWMDIAEVGISRYFFLIAWSALYLALGYASDVRRVEREAAVFERAAQQAELRALRYQVNPHFLFNTLNSLSSLVMAGRNDAAEAMIMNLATFFRTSLNGDPSDDVSLKDEIALQQLYLDIESVRFPERLQVRTDLPADLEQLAVPGLILQPLVENAIKHGVSRTTKPVIVSIAARAEQGALIVSVIDTGPGVSDVDADDCHGIGLTNVRERLQARFGNLARVDCANGPDGGFCSRLTLPMVRHG
jgi:two-component system, LytTR family, sensor kinase